MMRATHWIAALMGITVILACGGLGVSEPPIGAASRAGVYRAPIAGTQRDVMLEVRQNASVNIVVNDDAGAYVGTGTLSRDRVSGTATRNGVIVAVDATFSGSGTTTMMTGTTSGGVNGTFSGSYVGALSENPFAGSYAGTFTGTQSGTWSATVNAEGSITGTANDGLLTYDAQGTVSNLGVATFGGAGIGGGMSFTFTGQFRFEGANGRIVSGTWVSTAPGAGAFTGTRN